MELTLLWQINDVPGLEVQDPKWTLTVPMAEDGVVVNIGDPITTLDPRLL